MAHIGQAQLKLSMQNIVAAENTLFSDDENEIARLSSILKMQDYMKQIKREVCDKKKQSRRISEINTLSLLI